MTKRFYKLMCFATAAAMSIIGCGETSPTDKDQYQDQDNDSEEQDQFLYGVVETDYLEADVDEPVVTDTDEVVVPDEPAVEYGPQPTDYDAAGTDGDIDDGTIYGCDSVYFDDSDPVPQPDEMTTDYGPISRLFKKK